MSQALPIAVLVSGAGTNLQALLDTVHGREAEIVAVASNVAGAPALERAAKHGVPHAVFARSDYRDRGARDDAMADWLAQRGARLVYLHTSDAGRSVYEQLGFAQYPRYMERRL